MGDIIEITTHARHPTSFYRVSSGALSFEVKAQNGAIVGLAKEPGSTCNYWLGFGEDGRLWIKGPDGLNTTNGGTYSLSQRHFRRFWIAWDCNSLRVGQGREIALSYPHTIAGLCYVTFSTQDVRHPATWKFELPPASLINMRNTVPYKKIEGGELRWVSAQNGLPDDAVIGGVQAGECVYISRGGHNGSLTPGKFVPSERAAYVGWGGGTHVTPEFDILCGHNYKWERTSGQNIPVNAYLAGYSENNHENLYIGRVEDKDCVIPGKVQPTFKSCLAPVGDKELQFSNYEILTVPELNPYATIGLSELNMMTALRHGNPLGNHMNREALRAELNMMRGLREGIPIGLRQGIIPLANNMNHEALVWNNVEDEEDSSEN